MNYSSSTLTSTVSGYDKLMKVVQYGSKLCLWYSLRRGSGKDEPLVRMLSDVSGSVGDARGALRMGRWLSVFDGLTMWKEDTLTGMALSAHSQFGVALYYFFNNLAWLSKHQVLSLDVARTNMYGYYFWAVGAIASLVLELLRLRKTSESLRVARSAVERRELSLRLRQRVLNAVRHLCNVHVALCLSQLSPLRDYQGLVAFAGTLEAFVFIFGSKLATLF